MSTSKTCVRYGYALHDTRALKAGWALTRDFGGYTPPASHNPCGSSTDHPPIPQHTEIVRKLA